MKVIKRSIAGFIFGVIGICVVVMAFARILIVQAWAYAFASVVSEVNFFLVDVTFYIMIASLAIEIVALCFYFRKSDIGGLLMLISVVLSFVPIWSFFAFSTTNLSYTISIFAIINIPNLIAVLLGLVAKSQKVEMEYVG